MKRGWSGPILALALGLGAGAVAASESSFPAAALVAELESALDKGDLDGAIRAGEGALQADPRNSVAHDLLGRAWGLKAQEAHLLEQVHLARRARVFFEKAVDLDPGNVAARADLATYDMRAPAFLGGGKEKARRQSEEVLKLDAARGHELLARLAESEKDLAGADAEYRRAVEASRPDDPRARRAFSSFLVRRRQFERARELWREVLEQDPSSLLARYELAGVALASGEGLERSARDLEASFSASAPAAEPRRGELHERLSQLEARLGKSGRAREELEEALRLEPHRTEWRQSLARLPR